ncbi:MAG: glycosyltransferase family 4 protein [Acidimicrobiales bacterium]|nr:glycosyltransferase family 4 protein [Acidimicrobiales bacterium]
MSESDQVLRIAFLIYRGNPRCGGQGVYTRHLTSELVKLGHQVEVFSGPPYPDLDPAVKFTPVPSLELYRDPDPFRRPKISEFKDRYDLLEYAIMATAGFPEPRTFSLRVRKMLSKRLGEFDIVHDNQCLGPGLLGIVQDGFPLIATIHHPITVDRELDISHATTWRRKLSLRRWYGFLGMQKRVASKVQRVITVSQSSRNDVSKQLGVDIEKINVVPVGVDHTVFRPMPNIERVPGRLMTTASADVPMKGLVPLLEALAKIRTERHAELVIVGKLRPESKIPELLDRLNLKDAVTFLHGLSDQDIVDLYAQAEVAVVPSLYEGFSLPAIEAMACGVPLVTTTGGALPEVVGKDGESALLVTPNDPSALSHAIIELLESPELRARLGAAGRKRVLGRYTWQVTAKGTAEQYIELLKEYRGS